MAVSLDPVWIAFIGTVCSGVGLKVAEHWLGRNRVRTDDAAQIRDELRLEITALREENKQLEAEVEVWKSKYYTLWEEFIKKQTELTLALKDLQREVGAEGGNND
jgi:cell division protein FtsB